MWSSLEVSLDVVAACLPVIAPGLLKMARQGAFAWLHLRSALLRSAKNHTVDASSRHIDHQGEDMSMERIVNVERGHRDAGEGGDSTNFQEALPSPPSVEPQSREDLEVALDIARLGTFTS